MTKNLGELLNLLREAEGEELVSAEQIPDAKQPGEDENREVPAPEANAKLDADVKDLAKPLDSQILPENDDLEGSASPQAVSVETPPEQPESGEGSGEVSAAGELSADELASDVDPDVAEIIRLMGEADESDSEDEKKDEDKKDDSDSEEKKDEKPADEKSDEKSDENYNDVDNVSLDDDELKDVVDKAGSEEEKKEGEKKEEDAPLPGSEDLTPEQKGCLRKLFDDCVMETAKVKAAKAVKLAESKLNEKFKGITVARETKLNEQINHYLKYVVETWTKKNEPKLYTANQIKTAKKIFESVKALVEMFDIESIDAKASIVEMYEAKIGNFKKDANKLVSENAKLVKEISIRDRAFVIEEASKGLPLTEVDKFKTSAAKIKAQDLDTFKENVGALKVSFTPKTKKVENIRSTNENLAINGGFGTQMSAPRTEADLIASLLPKGFENNK